MLNAGNKYIGLQKKNQGCWNVVIKIHFFKKRQILRYPETPRVSLRPRVKQQLGHKVPVTEADPQDSGAWSMRTDTLTGIYRNDVVGVT